VGPGDLVKAKMFRDQIDKHYHLWSGPGHDIVNMKFMTTVGYISSHELAILIEIKGFEKNRPMARLVTQSGAVGWISTGIIELTS